MEKRYFEVSYDGSRVVVVALETTAAAKVKAVAVKAFKECNWRSAKAENLTILTPRGLTATGLGKRWITHILDLEMAIEEEVRIADEDFDDFDHRASLVTPAKLRSTLASDGCYWFGDVEDEWPALMRLLNKTPADRKAFEKAFDAIINPMLCSASAKVLPARARLLLGDYGPDVVIDKLERSYWVTRSQAKKAVEGILQDA